MNNAKDKPLEKKRKKESTQRVCPFSSGVCIVYPHTLNMPVIITITVGTCADLLHSDQFPQFGKGWHSLTANKHVSIWITVHLSWQPLGWMTTRKFVFYVKAQLTKPDH